MKVISRTSHGAPGDDRAEEETLDEVPAPRVDEVDADTEQDDVTPEDPADETEQGKENA